MASLLVVLIISGCVAYQYLKGTLVKSFTTIIITICASVVAFAYFELLTKVFIDRNRLVLWAQTLSFALIFVLAFAVLQTIATRLARKPVDLGLWPERIGRVVCGIFLGLILSGLLLTALAMAPLSNKNPYQRFKPTNPDAEKPNKALFNADGFATGWFSIISSGSFSGKRSFATLHPDFLDQLFLNRHNIADNISIITTSGAIEVPKKAAWPAPEGLKDSDGEPLPQKDGYNLTIVRVGMTAMAVKSGTFTFSQLRLVCKQKDHAENPLSGKGKNVYPIGYLKKANQLQIKRLDEQVRIERDDLIDGVRYIDLTFYVPNDFLPVLVEFKQNDIAQVPPPVTTEQAPPAVPFVQSADCATDIAEVKPVSSAKVYGVQLATGSKFLTDSTLEITGADQWRSAQTARSIKPAVFKDGKINYVRAELKIQMPAEGKPEEEQEERESFDADRRQSWEKRKGISDMLAPLDGYKLLSLKCNNPPAGAAITAKQLPVLVELSGLIHHPVGIIASGEVAGQTVYEVDYCSLTAEDIADGLNIAEDGSVAQPFPDSVWLPEQARSITEFYLLYLIKAGRNAIITAVQPGDSQVAAALKEYEGFLIK